MDKFARPTRILFCSYAFHPNVGGIETTSRFLADHLVRRGFDVKVVTNSLSQGGTTEIYGYDVIRRPSRGELLHLVRRSDLVFQNNISLNYLWPLLIAPKPLVIASHTPIDATIEKSEIKRQLKFLAMRFASCISVSRYLAGTFPVKSRVIYNAIRTDIFFLDPEAKRTGELLFVGRLTEAKGVDILLEAMSMLRQKGITPGLTIVGGGSEEQKLKSMAVDLGLAGQVVFTGSLPPVEIARLMNQHKVLAVPSRRKPAEALPLVPLEGIACGIVPVVAAQGGLPESIGDSGLTFECENAQALADTLEGLLLDTELQEKLRLRGPNFLKGFREDDVVAQYIEVFTRALPGGTSPQRH